MFKQILKIFTNIRNICIFSNKIIYNIIIDHKILVVIFYYYFTNLPIHTITDYKYYKYLFIMIVYKLFQMKILCKKKFSTSMEPIYIV